jgi:putative peptidoglycan lipid II flippase
LIISLSLINVLGVTGLALANTIAALLEMTLLIVVIRRRLGGFDDRRVALSALKTAAASVAMGLAVWGFLNVTASASVVVHAMGGMIIGAGVFFGAAWLLRVEELRTLAGLLGRKLHRNAHPSSDSRTST